MSKKILFFGNHNVGYNCLEFLLASNYEVVCVVVNKGHKCRCTWYNSVWKLASKNKLLIFESDEIEKKRNVNRIKKLNPDLLLSVSYNYKIPKDMLKIPRYGAYNLHGSYLPDYKGRFSPVWCILNGEKYTGVTLHEISEKIDSGRIVARKKIKIYSDSTAIEIFNEQVGVSVDLLRENINKLLSKRTDYLNIDNSKGTYYTARSNEENRIRWNRTSTEIDRLVRAAYFPPYNFAYTYLKGKKIEIKKIFVKKDINCQRCKPGTIITTIEECPLVATGDGCCLILDSTLKRFNQGDIFK